MQNKIKEKKEAFVLGKRIEKQLVQIPSESNENKMANNGENKKKEEV